MRRLLINGAWVDAVSTACREIRNPATLAPIDTVPDCGVQDVARAVAAASAAGPAWRKIPGAEKAGLLRAIGERILMQRDALATLMTQEAGTPLCESQDSVGWAAASFLRRAEALESRADAPHFDGGQGGVTAALGCFSDPLRAAARSVARALAAGRTVICKPPHQNPLASLKLAEICALLPAGVLNIVTGAADAGAALIAHPGVQHVDFAGDASLATPNAAAAESVEPIVVLDDAPLDLAVPGVAWARLRHGGQGGGSRTRIYVQRPIAAQFADRIHEYMAFLEVGDPLKPDTDLGPLISREAARRVEEQVAHAAKEGARLKLGGRGYQPWGLPGHFFQPTILTDVRHGSAASRESMQGPVLLITPVADAVEALRYASDYGTGLAGCIYTDSSARALEASQSFTAGTLEHVTLRKPWWFPYRDRKRPSSGWRDLPSHDADA